MINKFDYNSDDVMKILNNPEYSDEQKKQLFEKYKEDLKLKRKNEIIARLNECAKENPIITEEDYVNIIKRYSDDDLSKPFEIIETEIRTFEENMKRKYQEYLMTQEQSKVTTEPKEDIIEEPVIDNNVQEEYDSFNLEDTKIMPSISISNTTEIKKEEPKQEEIKEIDENPIFDDNSKSKEILPDEIEENSEKGNASAIIISIIAIIIGAVVMYSIIRLK